MVETSVDKRPKMDACALRLGRTSRRRYMRNQGRRPRHGTKAPGPPASIRSREAVPTEAEVSALVRFSGENPRLAPFPRSAQKPGMDSTAVESWTVRTWSYRQAKESEMRKVTGFGRFRRCRGNIHSIAGRGMQVRFLVSSLLDSRREHICLPYNEKSTSC